MPPSPFQQLLGDDFAILPAPVRRLHSLRGSVTTEGRSDIAAAEGRLPWLICLLAGLPSPGIDVPVTVEFRVEGNGREMWRRRFARRRYQSRFSAGAGRRAGLLRESLLPFVFFHRLTPSAAGLRWELVAWRLFWLPLPRSLMPPTECFEGAEGAHYTFDVDVKFPLIGQLIHYRGWLAQK
jgi:hypothetical protein